MATYCFPKLLYIIVIVFCPSTITNNSFITLDCNSPLTGIHNHRIVLVCEYKSHWEKNCNISWNFNVNSHSTEILCTSDNETTGQKQKRCVTDYKKVSLIIEKSEIVDEGNYQIFINCGPGGYKYKNIQLFIHAPYTVLQVSKRIEGGEKGLSCTTLGYPLAKPHWENENGTNLAANLSVTRTKDKLFNITTYIPVSGELCTINYSCSLCYENSYISTTRKCCYRIAELFKCRRKQVGRLSLFHLSNSKVMMFAILQFPGTTPRPGRLNDYGLECPNNETFSQSKEEKIRTIFGIHLSLGLIIVLLILLALLVAFSSSKFVKHSYERKESASPNLIDKQLFLDI
ncbi:uncharacterized protein LOC122562094 isoform X1 [Chiloscyllium plagiosum]|uniref:uncharacterized protein LOC122562094 isoform X1 n=1 Tax=Chiloscyllium plagiosum TaxID=36176 RepID=UPI001CB85861|nr:uncharacterized protein LOC122562094 isoform X1 [Chiloscyllium plagiosum]